MVIFFAHSQEYRNEEKDTLKGTNNGLNREIQNYFKEV